MPDYTKPVYMTHIPLTDDQVEILTNEDLRYMRDEVCKSTSPNMQLPEDEFKELTPWERTFMKGITRYLVNNWNVSLKQKRTIAKIYHKEVGVDSTSIEEAQMMDDEKETGQRDSFDLMNQNLVKDKFRPPF